MIGVSTVIFLGAYAQVEITWRAVNGWGSADGGQRLPLVRRGPDGHLCRPRHVAAVRELPGARPGGRPGVLLPAARPDLRPVPARPAARLRARRRHLLRLRLL